MTPWSMQLAHRYFLGTSSCIGCQFLVQARYGSCAASSWALKPFLRGTNWIAPPLQTTWASVSRKAPIIRSLAHYNDVCISERYSPIRAVWRCAVTCQLLASGIYSDSRPHCARLTKPGTPATCLATTPLPTTAHNFP